MERVELRKNLDQINQALQEKGYSPIQQIVGFILSEDPSYITNHKGARALVGRMDRDELLRDIVRDYFED